MNKKNQPDRLESSLLAAALAIAGAPFLFDKLASLMRISMHSGSAILNSAPVLAMVVGAILMLAEKSDVGADSGIRSKGGQHEL